MNENVNVKEFFLEKWCQTVGAKATDSQLQIRINSYR
jgi:hypothetical protein